MKLNRKLNNEYYEYINVNPNNKLSGDCVVRAIARATNKPWVEVYDELYKIGRKYGYMPNDDQCFTKYLKQQGWVKMNEPRDYDNKKYIVKDWIKYQTSSEFGLDREIIANIGSHHLSCIIDGKVNDIWDCSTQTMHSYWVKL